MLRNARVDPIGSLQRSKALLDEVHRIYEAGHTALMAEERAKGRSHLRELEDPAIRDVVAKQEELGLPMATDGEFRRITAMGAVPAHPPRVARRIRARRAPGAGHGPTGAEAA